MADETRQPETVEEFFDQFFSQQDNDNQQSTANEEENTQAQQTEQEQQTGEQQQETEQQTQTLPEIDELRAQIAALQQQNAQLQQMLLAQLNQQQAKQEQPVPQIPKETFQKILESLPKEQLEEIEQLYYEDPMKAVLQASLLVNTAYQQQLMEEARRREAEINQQRAMLEREFAYAAKELQDLYGVDEAALNEIADLIQKERPDLLTLPPRQAMRDAYELWKRRRGKDEVQNAVMQAFKNPQLLAEALKDPQVLNAVAQVLKPEIIKNAAETNATVPVLITNQPGGAPVAAAPSKPKSAREAGKLWMLKEGISA